MKHNYYKIITTFDFSQRDIEMSFYIAGFYLKMCF